MPNKFGKVKGLTREHGELKIISMFLSNPLIFRTTSVLIKIDCRSRTAVFNSLKKMLAVGLLVAKRPIYMLNGLIINDRKVSYKEIVGKESKPQYNLLWVVRFLIENMESEWSAIEIATVFNKPYITINRILELLANSGIAYVNKTGRMVNKNLPAKYKLSPNLAVILNQNKTKLLKEMELIL